MLHHRREGDRKGLGQFADRDALALAQLRDQRAPGGVCQRSESPVESGELIVNHMVKYGRAERGVKQFAENLLAAT